MLSDRATMPKFGDLFRKLSSKPSKASRKRTLATSLDSPLKEEIQDPPHLTHSESSSTSASTIHALNAGGRLVLNIVKESADAFPPLKSVLGGLHTVLQHYDVCLPSY